MEPFSRKAFLKSTTMGSLALASLVQQSRVAADETAGRVGQPADESPLSQKEPHFPAKAKRIIHLFMNGGPSQMDTFDPKPELSRLDGQPLPDSVRKALQPTQRNRAGQIFGSPFQFAKHGQSGLTVSELFPQVAKHEKVNQRSGPHDFAASAAVPS